VVYVVRSLEDQPILLQFNSTQNYVLNPGYVWTFENDSPVDNSLSLGPLIESGAIEIFSIESEPLFHKLQNNKKEKNTNWIKEGF
jgi:hypothetical protein